MFVKVNFVLFRRQDEIVLTDLLECAMSGKAEHLYQLLEEGDNLNSQVCYEFITSNQESYDIKILNE